MPLASTEKQVDLGVTLSKDLKPSQHCAETVKTANKLVGFIARTFEFINLKRSYLPYTTHWCVLNSNIVYSSGHHTTEKTWKNLNKYNAESLK